MPLKTHCPHCNVGLVVKESKLHKNVRCPGCQQTFRVEDFHVSDSETIARQEATETFSEPATQDTQAGSQKTIGRFQLELLLGQGAFGNVYRAYDPVLERHVALKVPRRQFVKGNRGKTLLDEARAAASLRHPHIVSVFDVGTDPESACIATEFVDGEPLSEQVVSDMPVDKAAAIVRDLATALHYAHSEHIVHRDVKPANVMIDKSGRAQLMDFGLAQQLARSEQAAGVAGTPAYMAPEQARGEQAEPGSDQYSLGVVLFELITGQRPFQGDANHVMLQQTETTPPSPRSIRSDIPIDLQKICLKAMSKSAGDRYESCEALATDLQRWLNGDIPLAANPSIFRHVAHWSKQRPGLAGIAFGAAGLLIAFSGFSIVWGRNTVATMSERVVEAERQLVASEASNEELAEQQKVLAEDIDKQSLNLTRSQKLLRYAGSIQRGYDLWERNRLAEARRLLDATPHDLRDWEYAFVSKLIEGSNRTWRGHTDPVVAVAASQDGRYVASVSGQDNSVLRLWNGFTGAMLLEVSAAAPGIDLLSFSGDGEWLAAAPAHPIAAQGHSVQFAQPNGQQDSNEIPQALLIQTATRSIVQRVPLKQRPLAMGFKSDGPQLIGVFEDSISVHEIPGGKPIRQIRTAAENSSAPPVPISPGAPVPDAPSTNNKPVLSARPFTAGFVTLDGQHAGGVGEGKLLCWNTETGEQVDLEGVPENIGFIRHLTMSRIAKWNNKDPRNFAEWAYVSAPGQFQMGSSRSYPDTAPPNAVRGNVNHLETDFRQRLAVSGSGLSIWPRYGSNNERELLGHIGAVHQSDLFGDSSRLASGGDDGTVRLWTRLGGDARFQTRPGRDASFSGKGDTIAVARMTTRSGRDSKTGQWATKTLSGFVDAREPEESGRELDAVPNGGIATAVDYGSDGLTVAIGDTTGQITLVNAETGDPIRTIETQQDAAIDELCFGRVIASHAESDTRIRIWKPDDGELIGDITLPTGNVECFDMNSDGTVLVVSDSEGAVTLWDMDTRQPIRSLTGHSGIVSDIRLSHSETRIAGTANDPCYAASAGQLVVWDVATGSLIYEMESDNLLLTAVDFGPMDQRIVTTGATPSSNQDSVAPIPSVLEVWHAESGMPLLKMSTDIFNVVSEQMESSYTVMIPHQETRTGTRTVEKIVMGDMEIEFKCDGETVKKTIQVPQLVTEEETFDYTITTCAAETRTRTVSVMRGRVTEPPAGIQMSPDNRRVLTIENGLLHIWDAEIDQPFRTLNGHSAWVQDVAWNADGSQLLSGGDCGSHCDSCSPGEAFCWNATSGDIAFTTPHTGGVGRVAYSPAGDRFATFSHCGQQRQLQIHNATDGTLIVAIPIAGEFINGLVFSKDGSRLYAGGTGSVRLWDAADGKPAGEWKLPYDSGVADLKLSPTEDIAAVLQGPDFNMPENVVLLSTKDGSEIRRFPVQNPAFRLAFSHDGKILAVASCEWTGVAFRTGVLELFDVTTGEARTPIPAHPGGIQAHPAQIKDLAFSPDNAFLFTASADWTIGVWRVSDGIQVQALHAHRGPVTSLALSPDGSELASCSKDSTVRIWDVAQTLASIARGEARAELPDLPGIPVNTVVPAAVLIPAIEAAPMPLPEASDDVGQKLKDLGCRVNRNGEGQVTLVHGASDRPLTDEDMVLFDELPELLDFHPGSGSPITDAGLQHLAGCRKLETLHLSGFRQLTPAGLAQLSHLPVNKVWLWGAGSGFGDSEFHALPEWDLTQLVMGYTSISSDGLQSLLKYPNLEQLNLAYLKLTDESLQIVQELPNLRSLFLNNEFGNLTAEGLAVMSRTSLERLTVVSLKDFSDGTHYLADIKSLRELVLGNTSLTQAAVDELATMKQLRELDLKEISIPEGGLELLRTALPDCKIIHTPPKE